LSLYSSSLQSMLSNALTPTLQAAFDNQVCLTDAGAAQ
jgi:hypothetical protein